jgi:hypothetical protein
VLFDNARLISAAVIVALLCAMGADVLCALPCAAPASAAATQASSDGHDHCGTKATPDADTALGSTASACGDHEGLAPAIDSGIRRATNAIAPAVVLTECGVGPILLIAADKIASSPPGIRAARLTAPLRI